MTYRAVVIDDQESARRGISIVLESVPDVEVVAEFADGESALAELDVLGPDIAFVDVQMPGLGGLEVLRRAAGVGTVFVLVTAHDQHAVAAFDLAATDYVVKPYTDERLISATERAKERVRNRRLSRAAAAAGTRLADRDPASADEDGGLARTGGGEARYVTVREGDRIHLVPLSDIVCLKADGNEVRVVTADAEHSVRSTLKGMLRNLGVGRFIRVHRSHAVNVDAVREIQPWFNGDYIALMRGGEKLRISRRYKDAILRRVL